MAITPELRKKIIIAAAAIAIIAIISYMTCGKACADDAAPPCDPPKPAPVVAPTASEITAARAKTDATVAKGHHPAPHHQSSAVDNLFIPITAIYVHGWGAGAGLGYRFASTGLSLSGQFMYQQVNGDSDTFILHDSHNRAVPTTLATPGHDYTGGAITLTIPLHSSR